MITVPITLNYDNSKTIGFLSIDKTKLPAIPDFCFGLGYRANKIEGGLVTDFELIQVSIINDLEYQEYLKNKYDKI